MTRRRGQERGKEPPLCLLLLWTETFEKAHHQGSGYAGVGRRNYIEGNVRRRNQERFLVICRQVFAGDLSQGKRVGIRIF